MLAYLWVTQTGSTSGWHDPLSQTRPEGAVAVVTGASSGIGRASAERLADDGYIVLGVGRDRARLDDVSAAVPNMRVMSRDLSREASAAEVVEAAAALGPVVAVVHAAGLGGFLDQPVDRQAPEAWRRTLAVNLDCAFYMLHHAAPHMRAAGWGRYIVVGSTAGSFAAPSQVAYSASKAGLLGFVRSAAYDVAEYGGTCNAVVPGWIRDSLMAEEDARQEASREGLSVEVVWERRAHEYPGGRVGTAAEVADVIGFLVSDEARAVNGQAIGVTHGSNW